jgi:hypothetical protein
MHGKRTTEDNWRDQSEAAETEAEKLPYGKERAALMKRARQLRKASQISRWLSSSGPKPPK